jgi:hypothetical protein
MTLMSRKRWRMGNWAGFSPSGFKSLLGRLDHSFEITFVLVRLDHVATIIVNADHGIM